MIMMPVRARYRQSQEVRREGRQEHSDIYSKAVELQVFEQLYSISFSTHEAGFV